MLIGAVLFQIMYTTTEDTFEVSIFLSQLGSQMVEISISLLKLSIRGFVVCLYFRLFTLLVPWAVSIKRSMTKQFDSQVESLNFGLGG